MNGNLDNLRDKVRLPLYDTNSYSSGSVAVGTEKPYFTSPLSATKTHLDTNLQTAGTVQWDTLIVYGIRVYLNTRNATPITIGDVNQILHCNVLEYKKNGVEKFVLPLFWLPAGTGLSGFASTTASSTTIAGITNGAPVLSNFYRINPEVYKKGDTIELKIITKTAMTLSADVYVQVYLESITYKKVN